MHLCWLPGSCEVLCTDAQPDAAGARLRCVDLNVKAPNSYFLYLYLTFLFFPEAQSMTLETVRCVRICPLPPTSSPFPPFIEIAIVHICGVLCDFSAQEYNVH